MLNESYVYCCIRDKDEGTSGGRRDDTCDQCLSRRLLRAKSPCRYDEDPFRTAVPFRGQTRQFLSNLSPNGTAVLKGLTESMITQKKKAAVSSCSRLQLHVLHEAGGACR